MPRGYRDGGGVNRWGTGNQPCDGDRLGTRSLATKPASDLIETAEGTRLRRAVGALDLTALGICAIIGTGVFVIIGEAIADSGPAIVLSFVLAGVTCVFSAVRYAELASTLPVSGSA